MGIYIKGIEMPQDGGMLCINIYPDGKVCINLDLDCKQIATAALVPPHGRLIDADALIEWLYSDEPNALKAPFRLCTADRSDVIFLVKNAPTIIPASEDGET